MSANVPARMHFLSVIKCALYICLYAIFVIGPLILLRAGDKGDGKGDKDDGKGDKGDGKGDKDDGKGGDGKPGIVALRGCTRMDVNRYTEYLHTDLSRLGEPHVPRRMHT